MAFAKIGIAVAFVVLNATPALAVLHPGDVRGEQLFGYCAGCHSLEPNETIFGPSLAGLFGRRAGSVDGFKYSDGLSSVGIVWNETTLDQWLAGPRAYVPGTRMTFPGLSEPADRKAVIGFLKRETKRR